MQPYSSRLSCTSSESKQPWVIRNPVEFVDGSQSPNTRKETVAKPSWRSLFVFTAPGDKWIIALASMMSVLTGLIKPTLAIFFGEVFTVLTQFGAGTADAKETLHGISIWSIALAALGLAIFVGEGGMLAAWIIFGERQAKNGRQKIFEAMLVKDMEWYDQREDGMGSFLIRVQTQIRELQIATSQPLGFLVFQIVASLASLGIAFYFSWTLTLVVIAVFPVAAGVLYVISMALGPAIEAQKRELDRASKYANTAITAIDTVKAFNGQNHEVWQYLSTIKSMATYYLKQARINSIQFGITRFIMIGVFVQGFWFGLYLVNRGLSPGNVLTTFYSCLSAIQTLEIVLPQWLVITKGMSAGYTLKNIMEQIQHNGKAMKMGSTLKPKSCAGDIEMKDVSFSYPSNIKQVVLKNATLFFPAGETTFLVGKSGSGKSTIGNMLMRYYTPTSGQIFIDGTAIETLDTDWLRQSVTLVQQQGVLFNETIMQNIKFGKRDGSTREDVKNAARTGCLEQTISQMPEGLDTLVGAGGRSLSGGQTQRVAIARARIRDAPILILDESTSALDHRNRIKVMKAIREWRHGKTTIIITHDMSQIQDEDYVYVLENSRVTQEGFKSKLIAKSGGAFASILLSDEFKESCIVSPTEADLEYKPDEVASEEDIPQRVGYISKLFGPHSLSPQTTRMNLYARGSRRLSSLAHPVAQLNALQNGDHWSSPIHRQTQNSTSFSMWATPREAPSPLPFLQPDRRWSQGALNFGYHYQAKSPELPDAFKTPVMNPDTFNSSSSAAQVAKTDSLTKIFRSVWPILTVRDRVIFVLGVVAAVIVAAATPAFSFVFANLLSTYYLKVNQMQEAMKWALCLLAIAVADGVCSFCSHYAFEYTGQAWVNALRLEALKRILAQPKAWFDREEHSSNRLNECLDRNAEEMRNLVGRFAVLILTVILMVAIAIIWSLAIAWNLTLVTVACGPVIFGLSRFFHGISSGWETKCNRAADSTGDIFTETFSNIRVVRALTLENYFGRKYRRATHEAYRVGLKRAGFTSFSYGLVDGVIMCTVAVSTYYGGVLTTNGSYTVAQVLAVINLINLGIANASSMLSMVPQISSSQATATQMLYLSRLPFDQSHEVRGTTRIATPFPAQMTDLSFTYDNATDRTLNRISLSVLPGVCTAIVGPSGSGKSTLAALFQGLYPPDPNAPFHVAPLTYNGKSILDLNFTTLRFFMAIVPQVPVLFPTSIFENITYGLREDSRYRNLNSAHYAAKKAGIHNFIMTLEQGYNTRIGDGGMGLSGGQAQRIAIARAVVRRPKILILDEATSALDTESAELIRKCIKELVREGVGVIMISHGVEMMRIADRIVVVEGGEIVEQGTFEELRAMRGSFSRLIGEGGWKESVNSEEVREQESIGLGIEIEISPLEMRSRESWIRKA